MRTYLVDFASTEGASMTPVIPEEGTVLIIDKLTPLLFGYSKGDVIISKSPRGAFMVCKRIGGVAGDSIPVGRRSVEVPGGQVWLSGDNRTRSVDSATYGPVPLGLISGRVRMALLPWPSLIR